MIRGNGLFTNQPKGRTPAPLRLHPNLKGVDAANHSLRHPASGMPPPSVREA